MQEKASEMVPGNPKFDLLPAADKRRICAAHNKAAHAHNVKVMRDQAAAKAAAEESSSGDHVAAPAPAEAPA